ncbi:hypothetical protein GALMADRAFT_226806 [Galerina marginata CBS 339.88]|uniref:Peptidase C14 caspase domain-containing protein n=1 Tax=Galerina marginata (strain CBS 339.88) TaxID=685588 RepID=A0A067T5E9_GALM3|nr:hypothetical protein GALMADRAFT_226806 [Galerina marginata CBS 339.88]
MSSRIFALIIGIDNYKSGAIWNLHSCTEDAIKVKQWFMDGLNVPNDQICLLLDSQATRRNIEDSFMKHLVNNASIERGDAVIIYFAGHGSCLPAPSGWFQGGLKDGIVEILCPYDHDTKLAEGRNAGISDRSLSALLDELISSKGNNITLLLDCCFSPPQTTANIRDRSVTRWTRTTKATPDDLYRGLWTGARGKPQSSRFGFFNPSSSHTLLAACSPGEQAVEGKDGGRFTSSLLHAATRFPLHRTSYASLVDHLRQVNTYSQKFVCLGKHKNRTLFDDVPFTQDKSFSSASLDHETKSLTVELGAIHGVVDGSEISLHLHNHRCSFNPPVAVCVIYDVRPTSSLIRVKSQVSDIPKSCWAKVTQWNNRRPFRVYLRSTFTSFWKMWKLRKSLPTKPGKTPLKSGVNVLRVKRADLADLSLTLGSKSVFVQNNPILSQEEKRMIEIENKDGLQVIDDAARFNLHLFRKNIDNPFRNLVDMEIYQLDPVSWSKVGPNYLQDGVAMIPYQRGAVYDISLQNTSQVNIWPYLLYMDPNHHNITILYTPDAASIDAPLPSQGTLEIGAGSLGSEALSFTLADHSHLDFAYLKLFLSSTPVNLNVLEQDPLPHWVKESHAEDHLLTAPIWDTAIASLIFIRALDGNT